MPVPADVDTSYALQGKAMTHTELLDADLPPGQRLLGSLGYPLSGGGLSACLALALCSYLTLLPMLIGFAIKVHRTGNHQSEIKI